MARDSTKALLALKNNKEDRVNDREAKKLNETSSPIINKSKINQFFEQWYSQNKSLVMRQTPVWAQSMAWILFVLGAILFIAGYVIKIDEVITVSGSLKSKGGNKTIKTLVSGRLDEVNVSDGDYVTSNQVLATFDIKESKSQQEALQNMKSNLVEAQRQQIQIYELQRKSVARKQFILRNQVETQSEILDSLRSLMKIGGFQRVSYLTQKDELLKLEQELDGLTELLNEINLNEKQSILESKNRLEKFNAQLNTLDYKINNSEIKALSDGVVFESTMQRSGVYSTGDVLLSIVPQEGFYAGVLVQDKDIGFIIKGQKVDIKIDAFPFTTYGGITGKITNISADSISPSKSDRAQYYSFPIDVSLDSSSLSYKDITIPLVTGMSITANIKLREKRLLTIVSDMFSDQAESLKTIRQQ